ncbi:benzoate/H(+) symporter BenE family transporter [Vibrio astriarenae]|uniref:Benzoate/H(+) symporter BenE family transporter n=1 Tax=Vibrio astriarenae TaxID=1481923 RepID=A0A7Z2T721_9VIBR|nr:benzoate/H(+) symporter BenE family transporter [Vibrio astriarenae]QIA65541.1 benzoate/H(+) symporter BenE family transporter [Vibrio astriarenae]
MLKIDHLTSGLTAVIVGYTSAMIIVIQAAEALGATSAQIESWCLALGLGMGVVSILLSIYYKVPILIAWSTPGAALLISLDGGYTMAQAIPAFTVVGVLIAITGLIPTLNRAINSIPSPLASAMLAAILLPFCIKAFTPAATQPLLFLTMFFTFMIAKVVISKFAMLILLLVGVLFSLNSGQFESNVLELSIAKPVWMGWEWDINAIINIGVPLYLITMLSQNLPGFAMLKNYDYPTPSKPILISTGLTNSVLAPIGGFSFNLAAITAAICMNDSVDAQKSRRYLASVSAGGFYIIAGLMGTTVVSLFTALPNAVSSILAGLALLGTLALCLKKSLSENDNEPALVTFLITLSGISVLGMNSTLWGLVGGLSCLWLKRHLSAPLNITKLMTQQSSSNDASS